MGSVACKNDNFVCFDCLIISPDPYFYLISGLYVCTQLLRNLVFMEFSRSMFILYFSSAAVK